MNYKAVPGLEGLAPERYPEADRLLCLAAEAGLELRIGEARPWTMDGHHTIIPCRYGDVEMDFHMCMSSISFCWGGAVLEAAGGSRLLLEINLSRKPVVRLNLS